MMQEPEDKKFHRKSDAAFSQQIRDRVFGGGYVGSIERYPSEDPTVADYLNQADSSALERICTLSEIFERKRVNELDWMTSVRTSNLPFITKSRIKEALKIREEQRAQVESENALGPYFQEGKPEFMLVGNAYFRAPKKEDFFDILADEIYNGLVVKTYNLKHVSGIFLTRLSPNEKKIEILLVKNKSGYWHFPGGKAEYLCPNQDGVPEVVTLEGGTWRFGDGSMAPEEKISVENPEDCLRNEVEEELGIENLGAVTLTSSGLYTIGNSRFLIHNFMIDSVLDVDFEKVNTAEIVDFRWVSDPFSEKEREGQPMKLTDQARDVLERSRSDLGA